MTALMESTKRKMGGDKDVVSIDGGQYPELLEVGSKLKYTPITRDPSLVGYWSFEEGLGSATSTDYSGNGNNGTWYGTSTQYAAGKVGTWAGSFNGSSDYINLGSTAFNSMGTTTLTLFLIKENIMSILCIPTPQETSFPNHSKFKPLTGETTIVLQFSPV